MTEEWGQRNNAPILRPGWGLGLNRPSFWQKDGVRKILQPLTGIFLPTIFLPNCLGYARRFCGVSAVSKAGAPERKVAPQRRDTTQRSEQA